MQPTRPVAGIVLCLLAAVAAGPIAAETENDRELARVRQQLEALRAEVARDTGRRDELTGRLKTIETELAEVARAVDATDAELDAAEARLEDLARQSDTQQTRLATERDTLAGLVRTAYVNGRQERLKMLLNQEDPASLGRLMAYYRYFNDQRVGRIDEVSSQLARIEALAVETEAQTERLAGLKAKRADELEALEAARSERRTVLASIDARLRESGTQISRLESQEATLKQLIEELKKRLAEFPVESDLPFARLKGKLAWPVRGTLLGDFGQPRAGRRVKWNGVLVGTDRGTAVQAIAHGRVAYADWLPGLGLLIVLDHGDGYLSLYGHNETVNRSAGEWVDAGDMVATVGDSGGQARPALYFELRNGRTPINPHRWFARRLSSR